MTSTLSHVFRSSKSGLGAQDMIKVQNFTLKNGMLRKKGKRLNIGKWPHRFVVLTYDSIYVYANESSRTPKSKFSLIGYNRVTRCEVKGQDWCFSIMPAASADYVKVKTFACFSDMDRKGWMQAIKSQIYAANNIPKPAMTILDQIKSMTCEDTDEDYYKEIEGYVYEPINETAVDKDSDGDNDDDDDDDDDSDISYESDTEVRSHVYKKANRSQSLPNNSLFPANTKHSKSCKSRKFSEVASKPESPGYETCNNLFHSLNTSQGHKKRLPSDPLPRIHSNFSNPSPENTPRPLSDPIQAPPPRYSEVYTVEEELGDEHVYANLPKIKNGEYEIVDSLPQPSLESMCSITDTNIDREQLITMLQATKEYGTYLIRRSRTDSCKVIAFLNKNGDVNEYKILGTEDNLTIDRKRHFKSAEELLQHYTSVEPLPGTNVFLKRGFHQVTVDT